MLRGGPKGHERLFVIWNLRFGACLYSFPRAGLRTSKRDVTVTVVAYALIGLVVLFLLLTLFLSYLVQHVPRNPVEDKPDWGSILDTKIPAIDGGFL